MITGPIRHSREPKLRIIERNTIPAPADLRREHGAIVAIVEQHPRQEPGPIIGAEVLDGDLHRSNIACQVFRTLELGRPCHRTNNSLGPHRDSHCGFDRASCTATRSRRSAPWPRTPWVEAAFEITAWVLKWGRERNAQVLSFPHAWPGNRGSLADANQ
jgi:hypothetical protein